MRRRAARAGLALAALSRHNAGTITTIGTLGYVKRLQQSGISREHAEAQAEALRGHVVSQLATKADLDALEERLTRRLEMLLWKHLAGVILGVLAVGGLLIRFIK